MAGISDEKIISLIASFYEAAHQASPEAWQSVYLRLAKMFSSGVGGFTFYNTSTDTFHEMITSMPAPKLAAFLETYQYLSIIRKRIASLQPGEYFNRAEQIPDREFTGTEIYRKFFSTIGVYHYEYHVFLIRSGMQLGLVFSRPPGQPNFNKQERRVISSLLPHLGRAFQIYLDLVDKDLEIRLLSEAFDRISRNVLVVDENMEVIFSNSSARELLQRGDGLKTDAAGRLRAAFPNDDGLLKKLVASTISRNGGRHSPVLATSRPSGLPPLEVLVTSFSDPSSRTLSQESLALIFISDPEQKVEALVNSLTLMYGLTAAEARIAALLTEGKQLNDICDSLGIKKNTGRTHLKRIFAKTETNRQADLVKRILAGPASIQAGHNDEA